MTTIVPLNIPVATSEPAIVIFPHAGGSPRFFHFWTKLLPDFPIFGITYPGRDHLSQKSPPSSLCSFAASVAQEIHAYALLKNYSTLFLVGHSMGAWCAYETSLLINHDLYQTVTIVSGQNPPTFLPQTKLHLASDEALIEDINRQNPNGRELWNIPELRSLFLPIIRMDYRLLETYQPSGKKVPELAVIYGQQDTDIFSTQLYQWQKFTHHQYPLTCVKGGHFYLNPPNQSLPNLIQQLAHSKCQRKNYV